MMECEVEAREVKRPSGLPLVQLLGCHEILQVLVVCPDLTLMFCALNKVPPLLEGSDNCQHLLVMDLVVPLNRDRDLKRKVLGAIFCLLRIPGRGPPVAKPELLALMRKGLIRSGEMRTGAEVTLPFNLANAVRSASPQCQLE